MEEIVSFGKFKGLGKNKKKKQIVLCHTSREVGEYLTSLRLRHNGNFTRIPHFVIDREGKILQLLPLNATTDFFTNDALNNETIVICLENLGWLVKKPLSTIYLNWIGNIYKQEVYEKRWRDYGLWQPYTDIQVEKTSELCKWLCDELKIPRKFVGHNTKIDGIEMFSGVCSRSNFNQRFTDLSPAFDFNNFKKIFEYEEFDERKV
jgi:N-acetyl-anhydromuramyl-L-alanine amidase AmpD